MVHIEYDKIRIEVPENWDDITLGFYETFCADSTATRQDRIRYVAKACQVEADLLLSWPLELFNIIAGHLDFLFDESPAAPNPAVEIGGVKYAVSFEDKLTLGEWVDVDDANRNGEKVLSNLLAITCRPIGETYNYENNEVRRNMFSGLPVSKVLGVLAFFLHCKTISDRITLSYSSLKQAPGILPRNINPFPNPGAGIRLSQIWPRVRYWVSIGLLRYRLRKSLLSCYTAKIRTTPKRRNAG